LIRAHYGATDRIIRDVYVPGCPPRPLEKRDGLSRIQDLVRDESPSRRNSPEYQAYWLYNIKQRKDPLTRILLEHLTQKFGDTLFLYSSRTGLLTATTTQNLLLPPDYSSHELTCR